MKTNIILLFVLFLQINTSFSQKTNTYTPLDKNDPVGFYGKYIVYNGNKITLGPKAFFIDGQMSDDEALQNPYVFNSIQEACKHLVNGTEEDPMTLYIAPWVYWIDNPDDPTIRTKTNGPVPFGMEINCEWLRFYGLNKDANNVVLACNRGQTMGAQGNFTMFHISGDGTSSENITFGNYCNVDLDFPLYPELSRKKRGSAIVQAQLIICDGDKIVARNTRFISRLNLCNFVGAKRILFDRCHMESTDDALCGTGVYLNCTFDFYSSKPFYNTVGTGSVFLNCDITSFTSGEQYLTKVDGQMAIVDSRFHSDKTTYVGWRNIPPVEMKNYQYNVSLNNNVIYIGAHDSTSTVDLTGHKALSAYRLSIGDSIVYNTYNLLRGNDDWDPCGIKNLVLNAEKKRHANFSSIPTQMVISPTQKTIETGKDTITLHASVFRFGDFKVKDANITWYTAKEQQQFVHLTPARNSLTCNVIPTNNNDSTQEVTIFASTPEGLQAACVLFIAPSILPAPSFTQKPKIIKPKNGKIAVEYTLDMTYKDESVITWYRCKDKSGTNAIPVAISRFNKPLKEYNLSSGDIGYYLMASVAPKHMRSHTGKEEISIFKKAISQKDIVSNDKLLSTDFKNIVVKNQIEAIPGFWTFRPLETKKDGEIIKVDNTKDAWFYGEGYEGNANMYGLLQTARSATLLYTPVTTTTGKMHMDMTVSPYKTAGQGFSVAPLYMDVLIKFNTKNMTGYGLRFIRTTKYGNAVDCYFVKYTNGIAKQISPEITTSCFRSPCHISLSYENSRLKAYVSTTKKYKQDLKHMEISPYVDLQTDVTPNNYGGFGIQYNGGSTTMINDVKVEW